jgi:hypothetical protein
LLLGIGQALYLGGTFHAALGRASVLNPTDHSRLLEWWAIAIDREAQALSEDRRAALLERIGERMTRETGEDPGSAVANYWLAVVARGAGEAAGAWRATVTGWVRARLHLESAATLWMQWQALKEQWR